MRPVMAPVADPGSFRDPAGRVLLAGERVFRTISASARPDFDEAQASGLLERLTETGQLIGCRLITAADAGLPTDGVIDATSLLVEHDRVPYISYPYEWPFSLLKRAALFHLDLHLELLATGFSLSDASAYNVQFLGTRPVFIDVLSIRRYKPGELWSGYRQFCEQLLNPLLFHSSTGIAPHAWLRGHLEGIPVEDMAKILPMRSRWSWRSLIHVILHARLTARSRLQEGRMSFPDEVVSRKPMAKATLVWLLSSLRRWIGSMYPRGLNVTPWREYERNSTYEPGEREAKQAFVADYVTRHGRIDLIDLGCNTGAYSQVALTAGAHRVIGFDSDIGALEAAVARADEAHLDFLPLAMDVANPSPEQGWAQRERRGFMARSRADGLLALALLHHIVIGRNVPMEQAVPWLVSLAPSGVIEFVPKDDRMVQLMLRNREDVFPGYSAEAFRATLAKVARVVGEEVISGSGRTLFSFAR